MKQARYAQNCAEFPVRRATGETLIRPGSARCDGLSIRRSTMRQVIAPTALAGNRTAPRKPPINDNICPQGASAFSSRHTRGAVAVDLRRPRPRGRRSAHTSLHGRHAPWRRAGVRGHRSALDWRPPRARGARHERIAPPASLGTLHGRRRFCHASRRDDARDAGRGSVAPAATACRAPMAPARGACAREIARPGVAASISRLHLARPCRPRVAGGPRIRPLRPAEEPLS